MKTDRSCYFADSILMMLWIYHFVTDLIVRICSVLFSFTLSWLGNMSSSNNQYVCALQIHAYVCAFMPMYVHYKFMPINYGIYVAVGICINIY
jgi:hypothetical protein